MDFETRAIHAGPGARPGNRRDHHADLPDLHLRAGGGRRAQGLRLRACREPHAHGAEIALASLENADYGIAFSSGLGATTTLMHLVNPGQRVVLIADVYGGVYRMTSQVYEEKGYRFTYVPAAEFDDSLASHLDEDVKLVWVETPSNPLLNIVDIRRAADAAHEAGALLVVDNTFATPYLQQPLDLGADLVVHSTTKYLGGHSDVDRRLRRHEQRCAGRAPLLPAEVAGRRARPVRRLARAARAEDARRPHARALRERPPRRRVPRRPRGRRARAVAGAAVHPNHEVARAQMRDFGGMVSFLMESEQEAVDFVARTTLFQLAESLGGVESLIEHPGAHDARLHGRRAVRAAGESRPAVRRHRVGRRSRRRSRSSVRRARRPR